ncbi:uncharacterized protein (DUF169 family) [Desulfobotulus alkaliphilus]|uniref:Uncharacterized protein (DUF169 family) n=1 Tax=Desulfobotulus alkaliphilus TaxID=622671 RepID=A0A562RVV8_9BACT|nr:DUF169 domain-containing protein [Desulfobotulus alkaliphilus]TWI73249.1 uncharacterized protein (DUF169 family) [Desulfobotulus alkaliphilus]
MTYKEALELLIYSYRLDFDPAGIFFVSGEKDPTTLPVTHKTKNKLTFCQYTSAVRQARYSLYLPKEQLLCKNARLVFGFREIDEKTDEKVHLKYLMDPELSLQAARDKPRLPSGKFQGVYAAPIDTFDSFGQAPDLVYFMVLPFQGYHILNDYMAAMNKTHLHFRHAPNSAVCGGSVWSHINQTANMNTMCAGSKSSGKTEMAYMNLTMPGSHFLASMAHLQKRKEKNGGVSLVGKGDSDWPGLDACQGCPLFRFDPA